VFVVVQPLAQYALILVFVTALPSSLRTISRFLYTLTVRVEVASSALVTTVNWSAVVAVLLKIVKILPALIPVTFEKVKVLVLHEAALPHSVEPIASRIVV
jgi:hypothetical protein